MACLGSLATCGSSGSSLLVTVSSVPPRATTLVLTAQLDGRAAMSTKTLPTPVSQFGVELPGGTTGHIALSVQALDADGCVQGSGQLDADLKGRRVDLSVALLAQNPRMCANLAPCPAGTICAYTPKPVSANLWGLWANSPTDIWAVGDASSALHYDGVVWQNTSVPISKYLNGVWSSGPKDVWAVGQGPAGIIHYEV